MKFVYVFRRTRSAFWRLPVLLLWIWRCFHSFFFVGHKNSIASPANRVSSTNWHYSPVTSQDSLIIRLDSLVLYCQDSSSKPGRAWKSRDLFHNESDALRMEYSVLNHTIECQHVSITCTKSISSSFLAKSACLLEPKKYALHAYLALNRNYYFHMDLPYAVVATLVCGSNMWFLCNFQKLLRHVRVTNGGVFCKWRWEIYGNTWLHNLCDGKKQAPDACNSVLVKNSHFNANTLWLLFGRILWMNPMLSS